LPFFNRQLQILDRIYGMGAHNFSLAPKVPQNGEFPVPDFVFLEMSFPTRRKFSGRLIFWGKRMAVKVVYTWDFGKWHCGLNKVVGLGVAIFQQTATDFGQDIWDGCS